ncbi:hypothetical protein BHE74_00054425 [Ensete ventricosum]|nr:hypothetical protein GW17_00024167 [Ensete ventricosum]RWW40177.1 hypothetical protein BHE74_00054425 [Ensete ventricosum]RZR81021.1 hypothetical protein BHM03_00007167 [Ensete ventricosum]
MYQSASRLVRRPPATERYHGFSPAPSDTGLYQAVTVEISTVTVRYKLISIILTVATHYRVVSAWLRPRCGWL